MKAMFKKVTSLEYDEFFNPYIERTSMNEVYIYIFKFFKTLENSLQTNVGKTLINALYNSRRAFSKNL